MPTGAPMEMAMVTVMGLGMGMWAMLRETAIGFSILVLIAMLIPTAEQPLTLL